MSENLQILLGLSALVFSFLAGIALIGFAANRRPKIVIQDEEKK